MLIVLSPAKSLDYDTPLAVDAHTRPRFVAQSSELVDILRCMTPPQLATLMGISDPLAVLNAGRYAEWSPTFTAYNSRQAVLAFDGDVYDGLAARKLDADALDFAQRHLRILSGLYGVLRPLDRMQPYRLEMGTRLTNGRGKDLYAFWGDTIAASLNQDLKALKSRVLVNLASEEYFKSVRRDALDAEVIAPVFEDWKGGRYKIVSFFAKRARGMMARFAIERRLTDPEGLKAFDSDGYGFDAAVSDATHWVFRRRL